MAEWLITWPRTSIYNTHTENIMCTYMSGTSLHTCCFSRLKSPLNVFPVCVGTKDTTQGLWKAENYVCMKKVRSKSVNQRRPLFVIRVRRDGLFCFQPRYCRFPKFYK